MKKTVSVLVILMITLVGLGGCGKPNKKNQTPSSSVTTSSTDNSAQTGPSPNAVSVDDATCNRNAEVHQERKQNLMSRVREGYDISQADVDFVLCMLTEKEDKDDFVQRVSANRLANERARAVQLQAQQAAEAARRAPIQCDVPRSVPCGDGTQAGSVCMDATGGLRCINGRVVMP
jgi:hypothetical protein